MSCAPRSKRLSAVLGGTQSLHTNARDEALGLPTEESAQLALRTQQIIAYETGITSVPDPVGGSYYIEELTDRIEREAMDYIRRIDEMGGTLRAIEAGFIQGEIQNCGVRIPEGRSPSSCGRRRGHRSRRSTSASGAARPTSSGGEHGHPPDGVRARWAVRRIDRKPRRRGRVASPVARGGGTDRVPGRRRASTTAGSPRTPTSVGGASPYRGPAARLSNERRGIAPSVAREARDRGARGTWFGTPARKGRSWARSRPEG